MTPEEKKARECLVIYLDPGEHDNLVSVWRLETIEKITHVIKEAYNEGLEFCLKQTDSVEATCTYDEENEQVSYALDLVREAIRKEKK